MQRRRRADELNFLIYALVGLQLNGFGATTNCQGSMNNYTHKGYYHSDVPLSLGNRVFWKSPNAFAWTQTGNHGGPRYASSQIADTEGWSSLDASYLLGYANTPGGFLKETVLQKLGWFLREQPKTEELAEAEETLNWMNSLQHNWNDEGAPAVSASLVQLVRELVRAFSRIPFIAPTGRGSIQMEYEEENLGYLEFELFDDKHVHELYRNTDREVFTKTIEPNTIGDEVERFYASRLQTT